MSRQKEGQLPREVPNNRRDIDVIAPPPGSTRARDIETVVKSDAAMAEVFAQNAKTKRGRYNTPAGVNGR